MTQSISRISVLVRDHDEAIAFFVDQLGFDLLEDTQVTPSKRWVVIAPPGASGCAVLLSKASGDEQLQRVGNQTGGKVLLVLHTDSFDDDLERLRRHNIKIVRGPSQEAWGRVVVYQDLYGNLWDLVERKGEA
jgi:catechol 2,3-dioxygenase-like lactoylglutathione lyase family enzyme